MNSWSPATRRAFRELAADVVELDGEQDEAPSLEEMARRARDLLARTEERTRTKKVVTAAPLVEEEPRREKVSRIRTAVFARAAGRCEFCHAGEPREWHHIIGGPMRRTLEAVDTTAAICIDCHRGWNASKLDVLRLAKVWALRLGFRVALRAIEKRTAKVEEAQRV